MFQIVAPGPPKSTKFRWVAGLEDYVGRLSAHCKIRSDKARYPEAITHTIHDGSLHIPRSRPARSALRPPHSSSWQSRPAADGRRPRLGDEPYEELYKSRTQRRCTRTDITAEEHHISNFDAATFFAMHDFDSDGFWEPSEIKRTYGFDNDGTRYDGTASNKEKLTPEKAAQVVNDVLSMYDINEDSRITKDEFQLGISQGKRLPDFGLGPGHHGDDEYEYEIHHYEMYHDENTREEDLTHPEDIEHFRKHDQREDAQLRQEQMDALPVNEANIPAKFRRD